MGVKAESPQQSRPDGRIKSVEIVDMRCRLMSDLFGTEDDAVQSWRIFRIMAEFVEGFETLRKYGTAATFMGSARLDPHEPHYKAAERLASLLAKSGIAIITGGGGGVMEAANVGAFKVGGQSLGINIKLPMEQRLNRFVTDSKTFDFFFSRKVMLAFAAEVYVYFPGGFGTLDEFFEILTLVQTKKISAIPIVLYDSAYWNPLITFFREHMLKTNMIDEVDLELFRVVDTVEEAYEYITTHVDPCSPRQI